MYEEVTLGYGISLVRRRVRWDEVSGKRKAFEEQSVIRCMSRLSKSGSFYLSRIRFFQWAALSYLNCNISQ